MSASANKNLIFPSGRSAYRVKQDAYVNSTHKGRINTDNADSLFAHCRYNGLPLPWSAAVAYLHDNARLAAQLSLIDPLIDEMIAPAGASTHLLLGSSNSYIYQTTVAVVMKSIEEAMIDSVYWADYTATKKGVQPSLFSRAYQPYLASSKPPLPAGASLDEIHYYAAKLHRAAMEWEKLPKIAQAHNAKWRFIKLPKYAQLTDTSLLVAVNPRKSAMLSLVRYSGQSSMIIVDDHATSLLDFCSARHLQQHSGAQSGIDRRLFMSQVSRVTEQKQLHYGGRAVIVRRQASIGDELRAQFMLPDERLADSLFQVQHKLPSWEEQTARVISLLDFPNDIAQGFMRKGAHLDIQDHSSRVQQDKYRQGMQGKRTTNSAFSSIMPAISKKKSLHVRLDSQYY